MFTCSACGAEGLDEPLETTCHCNEDGAHWVESKLYTAPAAPVTQQKPFMFGIQEPDGSAYMDEYCVDLNHEHISGVVESLNECVHPADPNKYKVVELYTAPPAPAVPDVGDLPERLRDACCFERTPAQINQLLTDSLRVIEELDAMSGNSEQLGQDTQSETNHIELYETFKVAAEEHNYGK
ncbi:hypothetical protein [Dickeya oryzae]